MFHYIRLREIACTAREGAANSVSTEPDQTGFFPREAGGGYKVCDLKGRETARYLTQGKCPIFK